MGAAHLADDVMRRPLRGSVTFASPPPDGGFLVLNDAQIGNLDLLCAIKHHYPRTKIYAQRTLPGDDAGLSREARRVLSIGNPTAGPTGMLGYMIRNDGMMRWIREAMDRIKAHST